MAEQSNGGELANAAEGYLLWRAEIAEAEQRAREFVRPMEWLTTSQRAEVEQHYVSDCLRRSQKDLERIAARCVSLRAAYEARYRRLRRRCLAPALALYAGLAMTVTLFLSR